MPDLVNIFPSNPLWAFLISLMLNIAISIAGVLPSAFLTAANIMFFGFKHGIIISIAGEAIGAIISFYIYRKGLKTIQRKKELLPNNKLINKLKNTMGFEAFILVLLLRVLPFIPSGIVTLSAAMSKMGLLSFAFASTLGKIPSLYIEALSVYTVLDWKLEYQITIIVLAILIYILFKIRLKKNGGNHE